MEYWKLTRLKFMNIRLLIYLLISLCAILGTINRNFPPESRSLLTGKADFHLQIKGENSQTPVRWACSPMGFFEVQGLQAFWQRNAALENTAGGRKLLGGPGSSPPRCTSKCGRCTPCRPVHVPVPPGTPVTAEYYPEAWRCKCGNKLYMP